MKKAKVDEDKPDGLEIASIGSLYSGTWDKKYWSSSRGKDRYPYPVGYQAVRAHNGGTYKMEIQEGPKGPLFLVSSADGYSCSGQTPDIAWEKFQKKFGPGVKIWHGKRFTCKIDGVEFFGFNNPLVQRLLRELVANVNGTAERNLSSSCNLDSKAVIDSRSPDVCTYPDLVANLARPQITGKRSKRHEIINAKCATGANLKRPRSRDITYVAKASNSTENLTKSNDSCKHPASLPPTVNLPVQEEKKNHLSEDGYPLNSVYASYLLKENTSPAQEARTLIDSGNCKSTGVVRGLPMEEKPSDRFQDTEVGEFTFPIQVKHEDSTNLKHCEDNTSASAPSIWDKRTNSMKEELTAVDIVISKGLATGCHLEEVGTSNSSENSEKGDFDSVGQEMAKSMMTFLLPQAIPLLKKASKKNKASASPSEVFPSVMLAENKDVEKEEETNIQSPDLGSVAPSRSAILENLVGHQCAEYSFNHRLPSDNAEDGQTSFNNETCSHNNRVCVGVDKRNKSLGCHLETSGSRSVFCYDVHIDSSGIHQEADVCISESLPTCTSSHKGDLVEKIKDACVNMHENSVGVLITSGEKSLKTAPDDTEETGNVSFSQVPNLVYSRRKGQHQTTSLKKGKCTGPLSESIICRSFEESSVSEAYPATGTLLALKTLQMDTSGEKSHKRDLLNAEAQLSGQSRGLNVNNPTMDSESLPNNMASAVWQDKKSQVRFDEEVVGHRKPIVSNISMSAQKQGTSFTSSTSIAKGVPCSLDLKPQNMEMKNKLVGIFELVGCYLHPFPVLSVLLSSRGNEIHICVLCGFLVDKDRTLIVYKIAAKEPTVGFPSFVGHTSVTLPVLKDYFGREIALERSGLQFTPDGQCLVLLDSIKTPSCRLGRITCLCSECALDNSEENAVKIVKVKVGYVSVVAKLRSVDRLNCLLVCEPNHLVAVGESGRLHLWVMNSAWSVERDKTILPANNCISPGIVELKSIPKCAHLVIGHNGLGEFSLWDISKRILVSKFSASSSSICEFFPVGWFSWQRKGPFGDSNVEENVNRMMAAANMWFSEQTKNHSFLPLEEEDTAVWLLVSVMSDSDIANGYISGNSQTNLVGWWGLALLVNNMVILGNALDPRAAAVGASAGHGIIGTCDGLVYAWEMSTGTKLGTMHHFKGGSVSCIAADDSILGAVAVASSEGHLLVYQHSQKNIAK
ncbi:hypothetical protein FNV43_RR26341 [Rhamnella rubrinervis]|uniref:Uncharacterized protein n=1 Tax=Rhamnella rubrinervis TaxID=2594499 RepID=A0A8K0DPN6_9ROSA|nr:hypothetical protein FNV43_RR26341 [Rhamnella rubrinervis]